MKRCLLWFKILSRDIRPLILNLYCHLLDHGQATIPSKIHRHNCASEHSCLQLLLKHMCPLLVELDSTWMLWLPLACKS